MKVKVLVVVVATLVASAMAPPTRGQQPANIPRIGVLISSTPSDSARRVETLQSGLRELGYVDGRNIIIEYRYADGKIEPLTRLAAELVGFKVDIIVTDTSRATEVLKNATKTIPIVFMGASDPVGDGQVASLAHPGGNLTGFTALAPDLNGKRLELLKETFPEITRVGQIRRWGSPRIEQRLKQDESAAKAMGLQLQTIRVKDTEDLERAFDVAKSAGVHGLTFNRSSFLFTNRRKFIDLTAKIQLPAIYPGTLYAEAGGLMSYAPDLRDNPRRAAGYIDKILKGTKPADLPVQQPMKFEFAINLKTAKQIGVTIPPNVLVRADRVIR